MNRCVFEHYRTLRVKSKSRRLRPLACKARRRRVGNLFNETPIKNGFVSFQSVVIIQKATPVIFTDYVKIQFKRKDGIFCNLR